VPLGSGALPASPAAPASPSQGEAGHVRGERSLSSEILSIASGEAEAGAAAAPRRGGAAAGAPSKPLAAGAASPLDATASPLPAAGGGASAGGGVTPLPCRLIDYFGVMVSQTVTLSPADQEAMLERLTEAEAAAAEGAEAGESYAAAAAASAAAGLGHPDDSDEEGAAGGGAAGGGGGGGARLPSYDPDTGTFRRRVGAMQYRYPKADHADVPFPENVDWFVFPNGIAPTVQPLSAEHRPATRRSVFVLSNVGGAGGGQTMYGCCLTAYRKEEDEGGLLEGEEGGGPSPSALFSARPGEARWWPVVLFMLTRYPLVPQLQAVLEAVYDAYDAGTSTGALGEGEELPRPFCGLTDYLRMLVHEVPLPVRRMNMAVQLFLPGIAPTLQPADPAAAAGEGGVVVGGGTATLYLPAPDVLPHLQFSAARLLRIFPPRALLALLSALALERRVVVVARAVQQLVEVAETSIALLYPLKWELPFIPVLPAHLAPDCLSSPIPFVYGLLTSYAASALSQVAAGDTEGVVLVDVTAGVVEVGIGGYLRRRRRMRRAAEAGVLLLPSEAGGEAGAEWDEEGDEDEAAAAAAEAGEGEADGSSGEGHGASASDGASSGSSSSSGSAFPTTLLPFPEPLQSDYLAALGALAGRAGEVLAAARGRGQRRGGGFAEEQGEGEAGVDGEGEGEEDPAFQHAGFMFARSPAPLSPGEAAFNLEVQGLAARAMSVLLHGYRGATFFPGLPPQYQAVLAAEPYIDGKVRALASAAALGRAKALTQAAAAGLAAPAAGATAGVGAGSAVAARSFFSALCETQCLAVLLGRHTSIHLRPFHALTATLSPSAPALADSRGWLPPTSQPELTLVVPPPGYPALSDWQISDPATGARALPPPPGQEHLLPAPQRVKKARKGEKRAGEAEVARRWSSAEVARALRLDTWSAQELELLAAASARGNNGLRGDDVGGIHESTAQEQVLAETAALLTAAAEAAGEAANPVVGRLTSRASGAGGGGSASGAAAGLRTASSKRRVQAAVSQRRRGLGRGGRWWRRATAVTLEELSDIDEEGGGGGLEGEEGPGLREEQEARLYAWVQGCLVKGGGHGSASLTSPPGGAHGAAAALVGTVHGVPWADEDDQLVRLFGHPAARPAFVYILQTQLLLSAGLTAPLSGANARSSLQLQPLLGLGVSAHALTSGRALGGSALGGSSLAAACSSGGAAAAGGGGGGSGLVLSPAHAGSSGSGAASASAAASGGSTARTLLTQYLSPLRFQRLAAACSALLAACLEARDYATAAPLLQAAYFIFTEPSAHPKDGQAVQAALAAAAARKPATAGTAAAWSSPRQYLHQELSAEAMWRQLPFWEAYVAQALAVEEQQTRLLHLQVLRHSAPSPAAAPAPGSEAGASATAAAAAAAATSMASVALAKTPAGCSYIYSLLSALIAPMLALGVAPGEVRAFASRLSVRFRMPLGEERTVLALVDSLGAPAPSPAGGAAAEGGGAAVPAASATAAAAAAATARRQLNWYAPFATGSAAAQAVLAPAAAASAGATGLGSGPSLASAGGAGSGGGKGAFSLAAASTAASALATSVTSAASGAASSLASTAAGIASSVTATVSSAASAVSPAPAASTAPAASAAGASGSGTVPAAAAAPVPAAAAAAAAPPPAGAEQTAKPKVDAGSAAGAGGSADSGLAATPAPAPAADAGSAAAAAADAGVSAAGEAAGAGGVPQHPWSSLPQKDAEAAARHLVALRRFPPQPSAEMLALAKAAARGGIFKKAAAAAAAPGAASDAVTSSSLQASAQMPEGGLADKPAAPAAGALAPVATAAVGGGAAAPASLTSPASASSGAAAASVSPTAPLPKDAGRRMPITRAFGQAVGLSVLASSFAATSGGDAAAEEAAAGAPAFLSAGSRGGAGKEEGALDVALETVSRGVRHRLGAGTVAREGAGSGGGEGGVAMSCLSFRGHAPFAAITALSHDTRDHRVATGGNDGRVTLWDMGARSYVHTYEEHAAAVTAVRVCGDVVVSASQDGSVRVSSFTRAAYGLAEGSRTGARPSLAAKAAGKDTPSAARKAAAAAAKEKEAKEAKDKAAAAAAAAPSKSSFFSFGRRKEAPAAPPAPAPAAEEAEAERVRKAREAAEAEGKRFDDEEADSDDDDEEEEDEGEVGSSAAAAAASAQAAEASKSEEAAGGSAHGASASSSSSGLGLGLGLPFPFPLPSIGGGGGGSAAKFTSALRLTGHSGPVTALDVWERPEEKKAGGWFSRGKAAAAAAGDAADAPRTLPAASTYAIVTGGADGTVRVWSANWRVARNGRARGAAMPLFTHSNLHRAGTIVEAVKLSADGRLAATAGRDGAIGIVDVPAGKTWVMTKPKPASRGILGWGSRAAEAVDPVAAPSGLPITSISIDVGRRPVTVTSAGADGTVRVWDVLRSGGVAAAFPSGSPVWAFATLPAHGGGAPLYNADGSLLAPASPLGDSYLVSGHEDGGVRKWDARKATVPLALYRGHGGPVTSVATLGDKILSGSTDGGVRLWDGSTGLSLRCDGHTAQVCGASLTPDYFLSAGWDGSLRCWFPTAA